MYVTYNFPDFSASNYNKPLSSILSPILFNVVMNEICLKMKEKTGDLKALVYADDMIWGNNIKELEDKVNEWSNIGKEFDKLYGHYPSSDD
jgi:hypothetical protein